MEKLGLKKPKLIISVTGGHKGFRVDKKRSEIFRRGLMKIANGCDTWIVTDGSSIGVSKEIGEAVNDYSSTPVTLIGIANSKALEDYERKKATCPPETSDKEADGDIPDVNHSHFLFVETGTAGHDGEIAFRAAFENYMWNEKYIPTVLVAIDGGLGSLKSVHAALEKQTPVVVVKGCGRLGHELAIAFEALEQNQSIVGDLNEINDKFKGSFVWTKLFDESPGESDKSDKLKGKDLVSVYDIDAKTKSNDIGTAILQGLKNALNYSVVLEKGKASEQETFNGQFRALFELMMGIEKSEDVAREVLDKLYHDQKVVNFGRVDIDSTKYGDLFEKALIDDKPEMVDVFLDYGFPVKTFLTKGRLEALYKKTDGWTLRKLMKRDPMRKREVLRAIEKIIQELMRTNFEFSYRDTRKFKTKCPGDNSDENEQCVTCINNKKSNKSDKKEEFEELQYRWSNEGVQKWKVTVETGKGFSAGTKARVSICLYGYKTMPAGERSEEGSGSGGDKRRSDEMVLNKKGEEFKAGETKEFLLYIPDIGQPYKLRVYHDNKGAMPGWKLEKVTFERVPPFDTKKTPVTKYQFPCKQWLATGEGDGEITRELAVLKDGESSNGADLDLQEVTYIVTVKTGKKFQSGTDANVYLTIFGEQGDTGVRWLKDARKKNKNKVKKMRNKFESGQEDIFHIKAISLKKLTKIRIGHDNSGSGPGWFLEKVTIKTEQSKKSQNEERTFTCEKWLARDKDDGEIEREITVDDKVSSPGRARDKDDGEIGREITVDDKVSSPGRETLASSKNLLLKSPAHDILIWAVLCNYHEMAKRLWEKGKMISRESKDSIAIALVAHALLRGMARKESDSARKRKLKEQAKEFSLLASGVLEVAHDEDEEKARALLVRVMHDLGKTTCLEIAISARNRYFISTHACQALLVSVWTGELYFEMDSNLKKALRLISCSVLPILVPYVMNFKKDQIRPVTNKVHPAQPDEEARCSCHKLKSCLGRSKSDDCKEDTAETSHGCKKDEAKKSHDAKEDTARVACRRWCHKFYFFFTAPITVYTYHTLSYLFFLTLYSYILIVQMRYYEATREDYLLFAWVISFLIEEIRQIYLAKKRKASYLDAWNFIDWVGIIIFIIGMSLRQVPDETVYSYARAFLCGDVMVFYLRLLQMFLAVRELGPKLLMIARMIIDLAYFIVIMMVFVVSYAVASHALLYPNSDLTTDNIITVFRRPYWNIYGELFLDVVEEGVENCVDDTTNAADRCPSEIGTSVVPIMMGFYMVIANILLLNLLIAMFSYTFQVVQDNNDAHWNHLRYSMIYEYLERPILFPPLTLFTWWLNFSEDKLKIDLQDKSECEKELARWENVQTLTFLHNRDKETEGRKNIDVLIDKVQKNLDDERRARGNLPEPAAKQTSTQHQTTTRQTNQPQPPQRQKTAFQGLGVPTAGKTAQTARSSSDKDLREEVRHIRDEVVAVKQTVEKLGSEVSEKLNSFKEIADTLREYATGISSMPPVHVFATSQAGANSVSVPPPSDYMSPSRMSSNSSS